MTKYQELLEAVADEKNSLSSVLFKSRLLADDLKSETLARWVRSEINGYESRAVTPKYRIVKVGFKGHYIQPFQGGGFQKNLHLSCAAMPPKIRDNFENHYLLENIGAIARLAQVDTGVVQLQGDFYLDAFRQYPLHVIDAYVLQQVEGFISCADVEGVLHAVRSHLLDFLIELRKEFPELAVNAVAVESVPVEVSERIAYQTIYHGCTVIEGNMAGDSYNAGQAGAMGPGSHAHDMTFQQVWNQNEQSLQLGALANDLHDLREAMKLESDSADHDAAIGDIANAERAALAGDGPAMLRHLKKAGAWAREIAERLAISLVVEALKTASMGS